MSCAPALALATAPLRVRRGRAVRRARGSVSVVRAVATPSKEEAAETSSSSSSSTSSEVAPSTPPPSPGPSSSDAASDADLAALKRRLVSLAAGSGRGQDATAAQASAFASVVADLVAANPTRDPARSALLDGDWELIYADTHLFRSSPFFWAVGRMMGDGNADFFYGAHAHQTGLFGGGVGRVVQSLDCAAPGASNRLVSDVVVRASLGVPLLGFAPLFSGYGSVITAGRATAIDGERLAVVAETTTVRQDDASVLPALNFLNGTTVPVEDAMRQISGGAAPEVYLDVVYLDEEIRVSKLEDGSVFVYQRV